MTTVRVQHTPDISSGAYDLVRRTVAHAGGEQVVAVIILTHDCGGSGDGLDGGCRNDTGYQVCGYGYGPPCQWRESILTVLCTERMCMHITQ